MNSKISLAYQTITWRDDIPQALEDIRDGEFVELGEGEVDLPGVAAVLRDIGYNGWAVVELDDTTRTPLESALISRRYLEERLELVE